MRPPIILTAREQRVHAIPRLQLGSPGIHRYVSFEELTGTKSSLADLSECFSKLSLEVVVRIVAILNNAFVKHSPADGALQASLVAQFLDTELRNALNRSEWGTNLDNVTVFHRHQQLFLLRQALRSIPQGRKCDWNLEARNAFGRACLIVNDLLSFPVKNADLVSGDVERIAVVLPTWELSAYNEPAGTIGRAYQLWKMLGDDLEANVGTVNYSQRFQDRYSFSVEDFFSVIVSLYFYSMQFDPQVFNPVNPLFISPEQFLEKSSMDMEMFLRILSEVSDTPSELCQRMLREGGHSEIWDFTVFRSKPAIVLEPDQYVFYDLNFLCRLLTDGIFWMMFRSLSPADGQAFQSRFGEIFDRYITATFQRMFPKVKNSKQFFPGLKFTGTQDEVADGLIDQGKNLVLMEYKGVLFTTRAKYSGDAEVLNTELSAKFGNIKDRKKGVGQIAASIEKLATGKSLPIPGYDWSKIETITPVLICYDPLISAPGIRRHLNSVFQEALSAIKANLPKITPLVVLTSQDVEYLEVIASRRSILNALVKYGRSEAPLLSFRDFCRLNYADIFASNKDFEGTLVNASLLEIRDIAVERMFGAQGEFDTEAGA